MSASPSLSRQIAALKALIGITNGSKQRPKPAQFEMLIADARAAVETLRRLEVNAGTGPTK